MQPLHLFPIVWKRTSKRAYVANMRRASLTDSILSPSQVNASLQFAAYACSFGMKSRTTGRLMMMINAHNLSMGCFPIFYLHKAFRVYLYHGQVSLCLQYYICRGVCPRVVCLESGRKPKRVEAQELSEFGIA